MAFEELKINVESTITSALKQMDQVRKKLLMVYSQDSFVGLISIGDLQRAIINNVDLNSVINTVLRKDIIVATQADSIDSIKNRMLQIRAEFMPVVDANNQVVDVIMWDDLFENKVLPPKKQFNAPVIIMAGGFGTRLKPLTNVLPKPLIPIGEKTILEQIFERFYNHGCDTFHLSVNYKAELIEYYLKERKLPYHLIYFKEPHPMGTAGSLSLLRGKINSTFFVSNCDIIIEQDYSEILDYHRENCNEITVVAALKNYSIPYGTIETGQKGELLELCEKPDLTFKINSGMYILEPHLLKEIPENDFFHITDLIEKVKNRAGKVGVFPVNEKSWKDIGDWNEYVFNVRNEERQ